MAIHTGSWGLPDFGITEMLTGNRTAEGGSNILGNSNAQTQPTPDYSQYATYPEPGVDPFAQSGGSGSYQAPAQTQPQTQAPAGNDYQQQWSDLGREGSPSAGWHGESGSNDNIMNEINSQYDQQINFLNQARSALESARGPALAEAQGQFEANKSQLETGKAGALGKTKEQGIAAGERNVDALTAARRLYNELQQRQQQQFGGASSAGQAFGEISAREQQRQAGSIQKQFATAQREIENSRMGIEQQFNSDLMTLQQQKQSAVNQVNNDFQNKLLEINKARSDAGVNKSQQRLEALLSLRNQVFQIDLQNKQFEQSLQAQRQAAQLSLGQSSTAMTGYNQQGQQGVNTFNQNTTDNPQTNVLPGYTNQQTGANQMMGWTTGKKDEDLYPSLYSA